VPDFYSWFCFEFLTCSSLPISDNAGLALMYDVLHCSVVIPCYSSILDFILRQPLWRRTGCTCPRSRQTLGGHISATRISSAPPFHTFRQLSIHDCRSLQTACSTALDLFARAGETCVVSLAARVRRSGPPREAR
jgi:hypothetical protein